MDNIDDILLVFRGFRHVSEARAFADWYAGQGEQDSSIWFECRKDEGEIDCKYMDVKSVKTDGNTVNVELRIS